MIQEWRCSTFEEGTDFELYKFKKKPNVKSKSHTPILVLLDFVVPQPTVLKA